MGGFTVWRFTFLFPLFLNRERRNLDCPAFDFTFETALGSKSIRTLSTKLQFLKRLIILVFHLASLSLAVYLRPAEIDAQLLKWPEEITDVGRTIAECITVVGVLGYILIQLGGEIVNVGLLSFLKQLVYNPPSLHSDAFKSLALSRDFLFETSIPLVSDLDIHHWGHFSLWTLFLLKICRRFKSENEK